MTQYTFGLLVFLGACTLLGIYVVRAKSANPPLWLTNQVFYALTLLYVALVCIMATITFGGK